MCGAEEKLSGPLRFLRADLTQECLSKCLESDLRPCSALKPIQEHILGQRGRPEQAGLQDPLTKCAL